MTTVKDTKKEEKVAEPEIKAAPVVAPAEVPVVPVIPEASKEDSPARKDFLKLIEIYKKQNPVKYEKKKEELARKLAAIK